MQIIKFFNHIKIKPQRIEFKLFLLGIFFLASAPSIGLILLLYPIVIGLKENYKKLLNDKLNHLLFTAAILMILKSAGASIFSINQIKDWDPILNWVGLGNWIPLFLIYLGSQIYVQDQNKRKLVAKTLVLGTVPVIFSCFSQYILKWYGPYELFNGFIIWYQRARTELYQPITGLFNNPNYTGAWLSMVWPFLLSYLYQKKEDDYKYKFLIVFSLAILFIFAISLINSRAAWLGIFASIPLIFGQNVFIWFLPLIIFIIFSVITCTINIFPDSIKNIYCFFIPENLLTNFNDFSISYENLPRIMIWGKSLNLILEKPFFGWGAATFPIIYLTQFGEWKGHPHNLFLELSISYGLINALIIFAFILILLFNASRSISKQTVKDYYERAWWSSVIVFLIIHFFDIVYFDLRISIIFWILLAGLKEFKSSIEKKKLIKV